MEMFEKQLKEYQETGVKIVNLTYAGDEICARILSDSKPEQGRVEETQPTLEDVYLYYENSNFVFDNCICIIYFVYS